MTVMELRLAVGVLTSVTMDQVVLRCKKPVNVITHALKERFALNLTLES